MCEIVTHYQFIIVANDVSIIFHTGNFACIEHVNTT